MTNLKNSFHKCSLRRIIFLFAVLSLLPFNIYAFNFSNWNALLKKYASPKSISGIRLNAVNYKKLKADQNFRKLTIDLESIQLSELNSKKKVLAFWINAYNILAVKTVLDQYPIRSIKDAGTLFTSVWKKKVGIIGEVQRSLHEIEHKILRGVGDPRIHAAIVCASVSCPDLRLEAFTEDRLDKQLDEQMRTFLSNPQKGLEIRNNKLFLSPIFNWFKEDFEKMGGVLEFISLFVDGKIKEKITSGKLKIQFMEYNWNLNGF